MEFNTNLFRSPTELVHSSVGLRNKFVLNSVCTHIEWSAYYYYSSFIVEHYPGFSGEHHQHFYIFFSIIAWKIANPTK